MTDQVQTQDQVNEFGQKIDGQPNNQVPLNEGGQQATLDAILAAVRGKAVDTPAEAATDPTPAAKTDDPLDTPAEFETGNKALDIAVSSFIRSTGATDADIERAVRNALDYGDAKLVDRQYLTERFGERAADAIALAEAVVEQQGIEKQRTVQAVYDLAGDKDKWDAALSVYKQHAPAGLQKALGLMFNSGDAASIKEAAGLVLEYAKGSGVMPVTGQRQVAGGGTAASEGLSAQEFQAAMSKLNQGSRTYVQDYERLMNMRRIGKQLGK
jgi:hypothetical protein